MIPSLSLARLLKGLKVLAEVATVANFAVVAWAVALPLIGGWLSNSLPVALAIGLVTLSAIIVVLAVRLRALDQDHRDLRWRWEMTEARMTVFFARQASLLFPNDQGSGRRKRSARSSWLPDPLNLDALALSSNDLAKCQERALQLGGPELGSDLGVYFDSVLLTVVEDDHVLPGAPWVEFLLSGPISMKMARVIFRGSLEASEVVLARMTPRILKFRRTYLPVTPWETDATWPTLVAQSWRQMSPFKGSVILLALPKAMAAPTAPWRITYTSFGPRESNVHDYQERTFAFVGGRLKEL